MSNHAKKRLSDLDYTGKKFIVRGSLSILIGILLILFGSIAPRFAFQLFFAWLFLTSLWSLISRWFKKSPDENILITFFKIILSIAMSEIAFFENAALYFLLFSIGIYQLFVGTINLITYWLYKQNHIKPRRRYLFDGIMWVLFGLSGIFPAAEDAEFQMLILGLYLISLGMTNIRDGWTFNKETPNNPLKRHVRASMPMFLAALIPAATLNKINDYLQGDQTDTDEKNYYNQTKENKDAELEVFIHTSGTNLFGAIGHVDICYNDKVISYGSYDPTSERLFGTVGDGVLFKVDREKYIQFCQQESHKTLFGYGIDLTEEQQQAVEKQIADLESLTIPWDPPKIPHPKQQTLDKEEPMYAYKLKYEVGAELFKFTSSKFKTYFVLSTNCVLLADSIIGKSGSDILSAKGFIAPGTYQHYLDKEYAKPNSIVVSKSVYIDKNNLVASKSNTDQ